LVYIGHLLSLIFTLIAVLVGVISIIIGNLYAGILSLVSAGIGLLLMIMVKDHVLTHLDQGRFKQASDALLIWSIVGLFVYIIPGLLMLIGYLKLQDIFQPQYQQYHAQQYQAQQYQPQAPPQQPAPAAPAPEPVPAAPAAEHKDKKVEMTKCRKCGVNFPSFMQSCPACNEPRH
jgi:hypothetical protein